MSAVIDNSHSLTSEIRNAVDNTAKCGIVEMNYFLQNPIDSFLPGAQKPWRAFPRANLSG
jgi:hypothetical protein